MMERDAELAADAVVLHAGVRSSGYAEVLLAMAERASWKSAPEPSLTFARVAGLQLRIGAILSAAPSRPRMRRSTELSVPMASALVAAAAGCLHVSVQAPSIVTVPHLVSVSQQTPPAPQVIPTAPTRRDRAVDARDWKDGARSALTDLLNDPSPQVRRAACALPRSKSCASITTRQ